MSVKWVFVELQFILWILRENNRLGVLIGWTFLLSVTFRTLSSALLIQQLIVMVSAGIHPSGHFFFNWKQISAKMFSLRRLGGISRHLNLTRVDVLAELVQATLNYLTLILRFGSNWHKTCVFIFKRSLICLFQSLRHHHFMLLSFRSSSYLLGRLIPPHSRRAVFLFLVYPLRQWYFSREHANLTISDSKIFYWHCLQLNLLLFINQSIFF